MVETELPARPPFRSVGPGSEKRTSSRHGQSLVTGIVAGMLAGFLAMQLGIGGILGNVSLQLVVLVSGTIGAVLALFGRLSAMLLVDAVLFGLFLLIAETPIMSPV